MIINIISEVVNLAYIHFTDGQKQQAASVDLEAFLRRRGERLISSGKDKRLASDHSITIRGNEWYDHAEETGGRAISFVQRYYTVGYVEAVTMLLGDELLLTAPATRETQIEQKQFILPPAHKNMHRVFAYLCKTRAIDRNIASAFAKAHLIYEDADYHNAMFVGMGADGIPRHAHKRSTNSEGLSFRQNVEGSDTKNSFNYAGTDGSLYVFEAPIDLLSYISLHPADWQSHSYVACCGTSMLPVLEQLRRRETENVYLCLDNDTAGQKAAERMATELAKRGVNTEIIVPALKDWNDDLREEEHDWIQSSGLSL